RRNCPPPGSSHRVRPRRQHPCVPISSSSVPPLTALWLFSLKDARNHMGVLQETGRFFIPEFIIVFQQLVMRVDEGRRLRWLRSTTTWCPFDGRQMRLGV